MGQGTAHVCPVAPSALGVGEYKFKKFSLNKNTSKSLNCTMYQICSGSCGKPMEPRYVVKGILCDVINPSPYTRALVFSLTTIHVPLPSDSPRNHSPL